jgi:hypothetical protein
MLNADYPESNWTAAGRVAREQCAAGVRHTACVNEPQFGVVMLTENGTVYHRFFHTEVEATEFRDFALANPTLIGQGGSRLVDVLVNPVLPGLFGPPDAP